MNTVRVCIPTRGQRTLILDLTADGVRGLLSIMDASYNFMRGSGSDMRRAEMFVDLVMQGRMRNCHSDGVFCPGLFNNTPLRTVVAIDRSGTLEIKYNSSYAAYTEYDPKRGDIVIPILRVRSLENSLRVSIDKGVSAGLTRTALDFLLKLVEHIEQEVQEILQEPHIPIVVV